MRNITSVEAKSILSPAGGYISDYDYTLTPYAGCAFACSYCYVPTLFYHRAHADTWGQELIAKRNAPELLKQAAQSGKLTGKRIFCSPSTDPYVPQEREWRLTRRMLEIFVDYPPELLVVHTRSPLVVRDPDLLTRLSTRVVVAMSVITDREDVRHLFEPRCPPLMHRVQALTTLHVAGVRTQASLAPLLPCDPDVLADLVGPCSDWVVAQALKMGTGARTWAPALQVVSDRGWEGWLQGGAEVLRAMSRLRERFGSHYHEAQEGFGLRWLQGQGGDAQSSK